MEIREKAKIKTKTRLVFAPSLIVLIDKAAACHVEIKRLNFFDFASLVSSTVAEFASCNCIDYNTAIFILSKLDRVWYSYRRNTDWGNVIAKPVSEV